jgi:hypothetical protein
MIASTDFHKMLGDGVKVIKYSDIESCTDINQVIPESRGYRIILIETKQNTGHYVCLLKYNNRQFEYFDSYGLAPDQEFSFIPQQMQQLLDEKVHIMSQLLENFKSDGGSYLYNKMKLQKMANGINTCGRWCAFRIYCFKYYKYDLAKFQKFMMTQKLSTGESFDALVCSFTTALN